MIGIKSYVSKISFGRRPTPLVLGMAGSPSEPMIWDMASNRQHGGHGMPSPRGVIRRVQDMLGTEVCTPKTYLGHDVN